VDGVDGAKGGEEGVGRFEDETVEVLRPGKGAGFEQAVMKRFFFLACVRGVAGFDVVGG